MRVIHVGLGGFGIGWCKLMHQRNDIDLIAIVDSNVNTHEKVSELKIPCYISLEDALRAAKPDFIFNATPPHVHLAINKLAFSHNIPVLMEKPISENFEDAIAMLEYAKSGQKLVVAENYRFYNNNIFVKEQIQSRLRNISSINMVFRQHHHMPDTNYHSGMEHPALIDLGVHHIDLLRFFTGKEVKHVYAQVNTPAWSWYKGFSNVKMLATMEDGVQFSYECSMDSYAKTSWNGNWAFTAENGVARYEKDKLYFSMEDGEYVLDVPENENGQDKHRILDEFIAYVQGGAIPQTDITDQIYTSAVVEAAIQSTEIIGEIYVREVLA